MAAPGYVLSISKDELALKFKLKMAASGYVRGILKTQALMERNVRE